VQPGGAQNPSAQAARYLNFLTAVPLLMSLNLDELALLCAIIESRNFGDGENIFHQGDQGHELFIILSGRCVVRKSERPGLPLVDVAHLRAGNHFGELALVNDSVRSASVFANGACECIVIQRTAFEKHIGPLAEILERSRVAYLYRASSLFSLGKGGVGLFLEEEKGKHVVRRIIPGGSAQSNGSVELGDICVAVEGRNVSDLSQQDLKDLIVGDIHTFVALTFQSQVNQSVYTVSLERKGAVSDAVKLQDYAVLVQEYEQHLSFSSLL
jgi:hypothetical protein